MVSGRQAESDVPAYTPLDDASGSSSSTSPDLDALASNRPPPGYPSGSESWGHSNGNGTPGPASSLANGLASLNVQSPYEHQSGSGPPKLPPGRPTSSRLSFEGRPTAVASQSGGTFSSAGVPFSFLSFFLSCHVFFKLTVCFSSWSTSLSSALRNSCPNKRRLRSPSPRFAGVVSVLVARLAAQLGAWKPPQLDSSTTIPPTTTTRSSLRQQLASEPSSRRRPTSLRLPLGSSRPTTIPASPSSTPPRHLLPRSRPTSPSPALPLRTRSPPFLSARPVEPLRTSSSSRLPTPTLDWNSLRRRTVVFVRATAASAPRDVGSRGCRWAAAMDVVVVGDAGAGRDETRLDRFPEGRECCERVGGEWVGGTTLGGRGSASGGRSEVAKGVGNDWETRS